MDVRRLIAAAACALVLAPAAAGASGPVTVEGTLEIQHADDLAAGKPVDRYALQTPIGRLPVAFEGDEPSLDLHLARVRLRGEREDGVLAVDLAAGGGSLQVVAPSPLTVDAADLGAPRSVAVLMVNFSDDVSAPWTAAQVENAMFTGAGSVSASYYEQSRGALTLSGSAFGWYTIASSKAGCPYATWSSQADAAAIADGVNLGAYQHRVYVFPNAPDCGWSGLGSLGGTRTWLNGTISTYVAGHEFGHNLGFHHASSFACSSGGVRVTLSDSCVQDEYGDPFDLMGTGWQPRHTSAWNKGTAGWLAPANKVTASGANTYLIAPAGGVSPGIQSLRVPRDGTGEWFYLEFRQPFGTLFENWGPTAPPVNGVTVRLAADYGSMTRSKLLDATPGTTTFNDAPLPAGATLNDAAHGITIICDGISPAGATVRITVGDDTSPPTAPSALTASRTGTTASLSWAAASDDRGVIGYRLYRDGQQVGTPAGVSAVDSGLDRTATYAYAVRAVDAAGNLGPPSATVTAALVNAEPSAPTGLVAVVDDRPAVLLSWSPSTDDGGVAGYEVIRDGKDVGTAIAPAYQDLSVKPGEVHRYAVRARDGQGAASLVSDGVDVAVTRSGTSGEGTSALAAPTRAAGRVAPRASRLTATLSWRAVAGAKGYRVWRNGRVRADVPAGRLRFAEPLAAGAGSVRYEVRAIDATGATGAPATVSVRRMPALRIAVARAGARLRVSGHARGTLSGLTCSARVGSGRWHACSLRSDGGVSARLPAGGNLHARVSVRLSAGAAGYTLTSARPH